MRFYEGFTFRLKLDEERKKNGGYRGPECYDVFYQLVNLLANLHLENVPHGDLKFENIKLEARNGGYYVWLLDSGAGGTAIYQAPEHYQKNSPYKVTTASDIYSIAIMLWEAITGAPPFVAETSAEVRQLHIAGDFDTALLSKCGCPETLVELILACLSRDPAARPDARELAAALKPLSVPPTAVTDPPPAAKPRASFGWSLVAGASLLLGTVAIVGFSYGPAPARSASQPAAKPAPVSATPPSSMLALASSQSAMPTTRPAIGSPLPHSLTADEVKAACAPFAGTDYACVPAARFLMGLTQDQIMALCDRLGTECTRITHGVLETLLRSLPQGKAPFDVYLSTFGMMRTPVTCAQYAAFLNLLRTAKEFGIDIEDRGRHDGRRLRYPTWKGKRIYDLLADHSCIEMNPRTEVFRAHPKLSQRPVELVSWFGADEYCTRHQASLPTEAQFAYVRGYEHGVYPWGARDAMCTEVPHGQLGDDDVVPPQRAECGSGREKGPWDVGTSPLDVVAGLNIKDLAGNMRGWTRDGFIDHLKACDGVCIDPVTPPQPSGLYAMSGGSYELPRWFGMAAVRGQHPGETTDYSSGFRCVKNTTTMTNTGRNP